MDKSLDLQDYLDATSDASRRTRTVLIVLVAASLLAFAGFLNSSRHSWMASRIYKISDSQSEYVVEKLGRRPLNDEDPRYKEFYTAVVRTYVENAFTIRVPFFGFSFDVNDLGLLGGISFVVILALLRFSIRSEIVSLRLSFKTVAAEAKKDPSQLAMFYDLLAMRQVLTMPDVEDAEKGWEAHQSRILQLISKLLCFVPILVYTFVTIHDFRTIDIGDALNHRRTQFLIAYTLFFWIVILALSIWCFVKWRRVDDLWSEYWDDVRTALNASSDPDDAPKSMKDSRPTG